MRTFPLVSILIVLLLLVASGLADEATDIPCSVDEECTYYVEGEDSYCHPDEELCYLVTAEPAADASPNAAPAPDTEAAPAINETIIQGLQQEVLSLRSASASVEQRVKALEDFSLALRGEVQSVQMDVGTLRQDADSLKNSDTAVTQEIDSLATGLAATQTDIDSLSIDVEKERSFTKFLTGFFIFLLVLGVALAVLYMVLKKAKKQKAPEVQPEIVQYITTHIRQGKKYPAIKEQLLKAGWAEDDIQWAYKETMRYNYHQYKQQRGEKTAGGWSADTKRTASIGVVTVLLVVGIIVLLRGVITGQAIHFGTIEELDKAVADGLERNLATNAFYPIVPFVDLCVQVQDGEKSVSYHLLKTSRGDTIEPVPVPCDSDTNYDFAVKFGNWQSFDFLTNELTCPSLKQVNSLAQNVVVLPSRYVLPGFALNPAKNPRLYCSALKSCLSEQELIVVGIDCSASLTAKTQSGTVATSGIQQVAQRLPKAR